MTTTQIFLTGLFGLLASLVTYIGIRYKARSDGNTSSADHALQMVQELRGRVDKQDSVIAEIRDQNEKLRRENLRLWGELQDERELTDDVLGWIIVWEEWDKGGAEPPAPPFTWRMKQHIEKTRLNRVNNRPPEIVEMADIVDAEEN